MQGIVLTISNTTPAGPPSPDVLAPILMVVGVIMIGVLLTMSIRGKIRRRNAAIPSPRERIEDLKSRAADRATMEGLHTELLDRMREMAAQLDNKAERLEQLIAAADARLATPRSPELDEVRAILDTTSADFEETTRPSIAPQPESVTPPSPPPVPVAEPTTDFEPPPAPIQMPSLDPLTISVYQLADSGQTPLQIAQTLDEQVGKVELILALRAG